MTVAPQPDTPWTLDEFVEHLNVSVPLGQDDARRANAWNPRLVRHYTTQKALSLPSKSGRQAYYGPQHLEEAERLVTLQGMGSSSKTAALLASSEKSYVPPLVPAMDEAALMFSGVASNALFSSAAVASVPEAFTLDVAPLKTGAVGAIPNEQRARALALLDQLQERSGSATLTSATGRITKTIGGDSRIQGAVYRAAASAMPELGLSTTNMQAESPSVPPQETLAWHRWSPVPGLDISLREDLWERESDLRDLLLAWLNRPS